MSYVPSHRLAFDLAIAEAMSAGVGECLDPQAADASAGPARTDEAEADTSQGVALDPSTFDTESRGAYNGRVDRPSVDGLSGGRKPDPQLDTPAAESGRALLAYQRRLAQRWQAVR